MLTIVVPDEFVATTVEMIIKTNQTNNPGDGKVFVIPVKDSVRIRTGESVDTALDEMELVA